MKIYLSIFGSKIKTTINRLFIAIIIMVIPETQFAQAPTLGSAANFVLFTSNGAVTNTGPSQITGNVGSNVGSSTGFGNVNGNMINNNGTSATCAADLLTAYGQLNVLTPGFFPASPLGNGATLTAGVYSLSGNSILSNTLTLNAQGTPTAVFVFIINGTFGANANSRIILTNGAQACNVYWKIEGVISLASNSSLVGTMIANNAAINISSGATLEGRALSTTGAITVNTILAYLPIGCLAPLLTGPAAPSLASTGCYALFSADGPVSNSGVTTVTGDIGSNNGLTTGFNVLLVSGSVHAIPDVSTGSCASDLAILYTYLNTLTPDILLLYPAQFGNNLVLTPHTYLMNGATTLTDSLYLNAQGNPNAVFVIQINGALSTSALAKVVLLNGTQSKNVFWKVDGAVSLNTGCIFKGTIVANNAAIILATGVYLDGRALTTVGALSTIASTVIIPPSVGNVNAASSQTVCSGTTASLVVSASGGTSFQWRIGTVNITNSGSISGATTATLVFNPVSSANTATNYNVVISGGCGSNFTSTNISLLVISSPTILSQPLSQTVCAGSSATFSVGASGSGLSYQWSIGNVNIVNNATITGANTATLVINPVGITNVATNYNVIITGSCAPSVTSANVSLTVDQSPSITAISSSQTVCVGALVNFSVLATGAGLNYQWRNGTIPLVNGGAISGATSSSLVINPVNVSHASLNYNVIISGACAPNFTSVNLSLVVNPSPSLTTLPISQTVCEGASVSFSTVASGTGLSYQWKLGNTNLINGSGISGVNTATLTINPVNITHTSSIYNLVVTGACAPDFTSTNVSLVVNTSPTITSISPSQTVCVGSNAVFTVNASGSGLTYQWMNGSLPLVNSPTITGVNTATLSINPVNVSHASLNYFVIISGICVPNYTSATIGLAVNLPPQITSVSASQTVCAGSSISFSILASGTGLQYQWYNGTLALSNGTNISGVTTSTVTINPVLLADASLNYHVVILGGCSPSYTSPNIALQVESSPSITSVSNSQTICAGSSISFTGQATGSGLNYQWIKGNTNLVNGSSISGVTTATLTINPASLSDLGTDYKLVVSGFCSPAYTSAPISLMINASPSIQIAVLAQTVCLGSPANFISTAGANITTYQWRKGTVALTNGGTISGANTGTLIISSVAQTDAASDYNLVVTGACAPNFTSANVVLKVTDVLVAQPTANSPVCTGSVINLYSPNVAGATYSWTGPNNFNSTLQNPTIASAVPASGGPYNLSISTSSCASAPAIVEVIVNNCSNSGFFIPQGFSPNGDGINDVFVIRGIEGFSNNSFVVFNRWGNKVFESKGYLNTFDGKATIGLRIGGDELPIGTYFYLLDLGNDTPIYKGTIYLNR